MVLLALLPILLTPTLLAQQPAPAAKPDAVTSSEATRTADKTVPSGALKGRVIVTGGRVPKNVIVSIRSVNDTSGRGRVIRIDPDGRFAFNDLSAGVYNVFATAPGFIDEGLTARDISGLPRYLPGAQVTIRMIKGGVITGSVVNQKGDPVVGVTVRALMMGDQRNLVTRFSGQTHHVETDDRGIYRIYGLPPGEYFVAAGGRGPFGPFMVTGFDLHAPTYYPSSTRDGALPVVVRSGEEATAIDIRYREAHGYSITGMVKHTLDQTTHVNISSVSLYDAKTNTLLAVATSNLDNPERPFRFDGLADGDYELMATFFSREETNWLTGTHRLTISGADVSDVTIPLKSLSSIEGVLKLAQPPERCDQRASHVIETVLYAITESTSGPARLRSMYSLDGTVASNNTFRIKNLAPGRFRFVTHFPTDAWYLREIQFPVSASAKTPIKPPASRSITTWQGSGTIKSGEILKDVVMTIGQDAATLNGTVSLAKGASPATDGLYVYLVPADRDQVNNALRYYETKVDSNFRFTISHVAPGRYFTATRNRPVEPTTEWQSSELWEPAKRAELRRAAEASRNEIELKSCQRLNDYVLKAGAP
ncbi:MAG TPA: carboxypeptidase regulatory-like domain-containing protein [Pyrinomonadaceae bacterium]|nr:carboxypeptidase regulatory-like domain-containing protein [Pyrinomonadaceae bacterium]